MGGGGDVEVGQAFASEAAARDLGGRHFDDRQKLPYRREAANLVPTPDRHPKAPIGVHRQPVGLCFLGADGKQVAPVRRGFR